MRVLVHFFFTAAHFCLALVAASISHVVTTATKFSCCSSNKKMSLVFISCSRLLLPLFSLSFAGLPPTFSFSLSFSCSIFQICGHDTYSKLNTLENMDTKTYCLMRKRGNSTVYPMSHNIKQYNNISLLGVTIQGNW